MFLSFIATHDHLFSCKAFNNKISLAWLVIEEVDGLDKEEQSFSISKTIER